MDKTSDPRQYRVVVSGRLTPRLPRALDDVTVEPGAGPRTTLTATVADARAVYGLLDRLRDLGIEVVAVDAVE